MTLRGDENLLWKPKKKAWKVPTKGPQKAMFSKPNRTGRFNWLDSEPDQVPVWTPMQNCCS